MTTATTTAPPATGPSRTRRTLALAGAETRLFLRNRTAVVNSVLLPLLLVAAVPALGVGGGEVAVGPRLLVSAIGVMLVFLTYYNLLTTFVARRQELVLQRMRTGELTGTEVVLGIAAPTLLVTVGQVALVGIGVAVLGEWSAPVDVVLPLVALVGGAALMLLLAAASTAFTRTSESAQITALPFLVVSSSLCGVFFPLSVLPDVLATAARMLPLTPVVELAQLGLAGTTWDGQGVGWAGAWTEALVPLAVLAAWLGIGASLARRWFRWAPRR
ncbi:ABC transporter permease [Blastococcus sp. MG754426]|uniref:ABC transporter permease n=1 Tax=unclassified Blastococcus TaxID=2619396 RepID=UPI001EF151DE|nr:MULTISPECIES: ABC transporter permease [unclassified Blastococcus]MCF6507349.1 ABC transporter permease [Blastococcus sp. MG754426]MCF6511421.1 ABC transporter permease [Blastococcus sp. MG754427]MCF6736278.1 ABC transporter permease [Blastococcus sp. KM273129]